MAEFGFRSMVSTGIGARQRDHFDYFLMSVVMALVGMGILVIFSTSYIAALKQLGDSAYFLKRQLCFTLLGFGFLLGAAFVDYRWWGRCSGFLFFGVLVLLVLVLIPGLGVRVGGSSRWIRFGWLHFQPTELAKLAVVVTIAWVISRKTDGETGDPPILVPLAVGGLVAFLIFWQPDFGSAVLVGMLAVVLLAAAGVRWSSLFSLTVLSLPVLGIMVISGSGYRWRRITAFLNPWSDPEGNGFHIIQSFVAFAQGGIAGQGLGEGRQKLFFLPEAHTDFIFAVIGEELGFLGITGILLLYLAFIHRGVRIALRSPDAFGQLLTFGLVMMVGIQALLNMGVVLGMLPTKGMTLPFISYGGTSLVVNLVAVGLILSVASHPTPPRK